MLILGVLYIVCVVMIVRNEYTNYDLYERIDFYQIVWACVFAFMAGADILIGILKIIGKV